MSIWDKIRAFFTGNENTATSEPVVPTRETLSFTEADVKTAAALNETQDSRMTEEYQSFLKENYEAGADDTLAWDSDYEADDASV